MRMDIDKGELAGGKVEEAEGGGFPVGAGGGADGLDAVVFEEAF